MSTALYIALLVALIALQVAVDPSPRTLRTLKIVAIGGLVSAVIAWIWPLQVAQVLLGIFGLAVLWVVACFLLWPVICLFRLFERN